jgi:hypothetical protein
MGLLLEKNSHKDHQKKVHDTKRQDQAIETP